LGNVSTNDVRTQVAPVGLNGVLPNVICPNDLMAGLRETKVHSARAAEK
jgi:hypothetical protein